MQSSVYVSIQFEFHWKMHFDPANGSIYALQFFAEPISKSHTRSCMHEQAQLSKWVTAWIEPVKSIRNSGKWVSQTWVFPPKLWHYSHPLCECVVRMRLRVACLSIMLPNTRNAMQICICIVCDVCAINGWRYKELKCISIKCTSMRLPSHLDWNIWSNKMQLKRWTLDAVKGNEMEIEWRLCRKCWFHVTMGAKICTFAAAKRDKVKDKLCVLLFRSK